MSRRPRWRNTFRLQFVSDLQHGLFPLQSPLLRESWLVSFPPLSYMLKFSGSSCLIGDPKLKPRSRIRQPRRHACPNTSQRDASYEHASPPRPVCDVPQPRRAPRLLDYTSTTVVITAKHAPRLPASAQKHQGSGRPQAQQCQTRTTTVIRAEARTYHVHVFAKLLDQH